MVDANTIPDLDARQRLAAAATRAAREAFDRRGGEGPYPVVVSAASTPEQIAGWLQANDPNGSHTADRIVDDGGEPYDLPGAWAALACVFDRNR